MKSSQEYFLKFNWFYTFYSPPASMSIQSVFYIEAFNHHPGFFTARVGMFR